AWIARAADVAEGQAGERVGADEGERRTSVERHRLGSNRAIVLGDGPAVDRQAAGGQVARGASGADLERRLVDDGAAAVVVGVAGQDDRAGRAPDTAPGDEPHRAAAAAGVV